MSLFENMLPSLNEDDNNNESIFSPKQMPVKRKFIANNKGEKSTTAVVVGGTTNKRESSDILQYVKYEEEIAALQDQFNEKYEKFVHINGVDAFDDVSKVVNNEQKRVRFDLKKWKMDLLCLRVKQREILYPGLFDANGIIDCRSFIDQKIKILNLEVEVKDLKKTLKKCFCTSGKSREERMSLFVSDLIKLD